ncbi:MAG: methionine--tRNA ligase [Planctomycetota bacterium]
MARNIVVTSALPYANGPIHIGHLVEYIQTDIWVRYHRCIGNRCLYFCADDTHGTPIMIRARQEGISPEKLIERVHSEHKADFDRFYVEFDNYYSTHSEENRHLSELIYNRVKERNSIVKRSVEQAYCEKCSMWLPDRYVKGTCPRCKADDQYGDSCDACGGTHQPTELINARCAQCGTPPVRRSSEHYFFRVADYEQDLKRLIKNGYTQKSVANKLDEWFNTGLKDWDISRDGPYFGFKIPGEQNKFFYVWLDAPIGYIASAKNYCDRQGLDFEEVWNSEDWELYHFIGKDIMYFHALFWPAMLIGAGFKTANKLFVHGFLIINGEKMSKSKGTFVKASTYLKYLDPEYLRYYYAGKLSGGVEDIDLSLSDFVNRVNSDMVGKLANLASRCGPMLTKKLSGRMGQSDRTGLELIEKLRSARTRIISDYEKLNYASVVRTVTSLADEVNRFVERNEPWKTIKNDAEKTRCTITTVLNAVRILTVYLKPVLPEYARKIERFLNIEPLMFSDVDTTLEDHHINTFERLIERVEMDKVIAMTEASKETQDSKNIQPVTQEPLESQCTIEDFMKIDLRIARIISAQAVEGADKLLCLELDIGGIRKNVFAGIAKAYKPEELVDRIVVCAANLKPRRMKFGVSEGMILAAGPGESDIFLLGVDSGAKPGQRVH